MSEQNTNKHSNSRRDRLRRERERQAAGAKRLKRLITTAWIAGLTVIAVMIGSMVWSISSNRATVGAAATPGTGALVRPNLATDAGALRFGKPTAPVTLTLYADFMCPYCGQFERANGADLDRAVLEGTIRLDVHPLSFLDRQSAGGRYSTRAANAFVTIAHADPDAALRFNRLLYGNQPTEGSTGLSNEQLAGYATPAGASAEVADSLSRETYTPWVEQSTQQAFGSGIKQTPTVLIDGQEFTGDLFTSGALKAAIDQAAAGG